MSIFNRSEPTPPAAPSPEAPAPAASDAASRADFTLLSGQLGTLIESVRDLAQRPVIVQPSAPPAPAALTDVPDAELDEAIREGKGSTVKELVDRKIAAARRELASEVAGLRDYGAATMGSLAEKGFVNGLELAERELFVRFEKEIKGLVGQCDPALRGNPETWQAAFDNILGRNHKVLSAERAESFVRQRDAAAAAPTPGSSGAAPANRAPEDSIPDLHAVAGEFGSMLGDMNEAEFIRKINRGKPAAQKYKDWTDYVLRGRKLDEQLGALRDGSDDGGVGSLPASLQ